MLPASLIADCSSSPKSPLGSSGRRSISCASLIAVGRGNTSSVRPVRSPIMCMSTAAIGSSPSSICEGTSSSAAIVIVGTVIMIVLPVICESAVAAWPAPMFAVSRSASSSRVLSCSRSAIACSLIETADIDDQRGCAVGQDRCATEQGEPITHAVESLHHDVLLSRELIHHESRSPSIALDHDHLSRAIHAHERRLGKSDDLAELQQRHDLVAQHHDLSPL